MPVCVCAGAGGGQPRGTAPEDLVLWFAFSLRLLARPEEGDDTTALAPRVVLSGMRKQLASANWLLKDWGSPMRCAKSRLFWTRFP